MSALLISVLENFLLEQQTRSGGSLLHRQFCLLHRQVYGSAP